MHYSLIFPTKVLLVFVFSLCIARAHDVNDDRQVDLPDYAQRLARTQYIRQYQFANAMLQKASFKIEQAKLQAAGVSVEEMNRQLAGRLMAFPFTAQPELKSTGTVKTLTVLIDFKDHRAATELPTMTPTSIGQNIYGNGTVDAQNFVPYESVHAYYERASEGKVHLAGNVLGWHHFGNDRKTYEPVTAPAGPTQSQQQARNDNAALFKIISEALAANDTTHDFAQYDNDLDGDIDLVTILYAGPRGAWSSFWWAYRWEFFIPEALTNTFDGKRVKQFVFQFVDERGANHDYDPKTLMHEMGHAFGLADYYDYDDSVGPPGGIGGLDMMHGNWGNHNAFSRWLLDWIQPEVLGSAPPATKTLVASGASGVSGQKAIAIFPGLSSSSSPSSEMFLIENRTQIGNDSGHAQTPSSGLLVWHVDATVNNAGKDFLFDNSFASRKLIRMVRAGTSNDFGANDHATSSDYFVSGKSFAPGTSPSSNGYTGPTNISFSDISAANERMDIRVGFLNPLGPTPAGPSLSESTSGSLATALRRSIEQLPVSIDRIQSFDDTLATSSPDELRRLWNDINKVTSNTLNREQLESLKKTLLIRWATKDGDGAIKAFLEAGGASKSTDFTQMLEAWGNNDISGAANWFFSKEAEFHRESKQLRPSSDFIRKSIEHLGLLDNETVISAMEKLTDIPAMFQASNGFARAMQMKGVLESDIRLEYSKLKKNAKPFEAIDSLKKSMNDFRKEINEDIRSDVLGSLLLQHDSR